MTIDAGGPSGAGHALRLRLVPTPVSAPPYDDERRTAEPMLRGALALTLPLADPDPGPPRLRLVGAPTGGLAPVGLWAARLVRGLLESLAGLRPVAQLAGWTSPEVCALLGRRVTVAARCRDLPGECGRLLSLHVSEPVAGVAEVCAVVDFGRRTRAFALRLEATDRSWQCTALQVC